MVAGVKLFLFLELALQHVSLALRGEVGWEVVGPQPEIGWRLRKNYFQVKYKTTPKDDLLASWVDYGPDKYLEDKDMHAIFKSLGQIQVSSAALSIKTKLININLFDLTASIYTFHRAVSLY